MFHGTSILHVVRNIYMMPKKKSFFNSNTRSGEEKQRQIRRGVQEWLGVRRKSLDVEIDGMELDEDCLVRVGRAGTGGAGADAQNPAQKEAIESRLSTKEQWTVWLAVVDAHLC